MHLESSWRSGESIDALPENELVELQRVIEGLRKKAPIRKVPPQPMDLLTKNAVLVDTNLLIF